MTSDEIRKHRDKIDHETTHDTDAKWEIAYQLAVMNEREASGDQQAVDEMLKKVGLGSPVGADSDKNSARGWVAR